MASEDPRKGQSHGALLGRLLWPTGLLFASTFCLVVVTFVWTARDADNVAAAFEESRLQVALRNYLDDAGRDLANLLDSPVSLPSDDEGPTVPPPFDGMEILTADGDRLASAGAWHRPASPGFTALRPAIAALPSPPARGNHPIGLRGGHDLADVVRRLVAAEDGAYTLLAATLDGPARDVAVAWRRLRVEDLAQIGTTAQISGLRTTSAAPAAAGATDTAAFVWNTEPVGLIVQQRLAPLVIAALSAAVLLFGAVVAFYFWTTRHLSEAEAASKAMLGRDPLSGLPNRTLFNDRLDTELRLLLDKGTGLAVMFIDLDRFKDVNDTHGHQAGDELIKLVAQRLLAELPAVDTLARFGGDEFAIIQTNVREVAEVSELASRILEALGRPFVLAHSQVTIGTSIGVALAPEQATDRHNLLKLADTALYQAKNGGRNRTSFFQRHMDETIRMRKMVEEDLRAAIESDGLKLLYQPLVSADGAKIVGVEALVRWPHPTRGIVSPAEFIPIAEERGLVIPLEEWVLRRACRDGARWPGLQIAVNVSPVQFRHREYVSTVKRVLAETGFEPGRLELELTEGVVVADADAAEAAMMDLRALGVNLALDDFGTGYSSLIYLRRFAFDKIKIDRSFLESMEATGESAILVHSIVHLGRALGLTVTAEGVETSEQHRFLQALGCHQLQGYLFSAPVPAERIDEMLAQQSLTRISAAA